jgi:hypothetical protein
MVIASTDTYQGNTLSSKKFKIASTVEQYGSNSRGLHFVVEKEESVYLSQMLQKN